jgi:manganese/zinc/iron transport system permease protein
MTHLQLELISIAVLTAITCCIPGVFLVLRGVAMMSDAISHAILLGIVLMFLMVKQLNSPLLIVGAASAGLLTVICTELIIRSKKLKQDAAIGLIFPLFFSIGVILVSHYARNVHLDVDMVLLGELAFAPFNRCIIAGIDCGPYALWVAGAGLITNIFFVTLFYKELVLTTFDGTFARIVGFSPTFFYYGLMTATSLTAVATFDIVGSIMVVALMITPAATAYLVSKRVADMLKISLFIAAFSAISGYFCAYWADVSIAGSIASMTGVFFLGVILLGVRITRAANFILRYSKK